MDEEREPDEWGDPGRLVRRRLLAVDGPTASSWFQHLNMARTPWRLKLIDRVGPIEWSGE